MFAPKPPKLSAELKVGLLITFLVFCMCWSSMSEASSPETRANKEACTELATKWVDRSDKWSNPRVQGFNKMQGTLYCIVRVTEQKLNYSKPTLLRMAYGKTGQFIVKRFGNI